MAESTNQAPIQNNIFIGGMNTDTDDSLLKSDQYRMAKNVRLTTNTQNSTGSLHNIEGCVKSTAWSNANTLGTIIRVDNIRNYGIVITKTLTNWYIYTFEYAPANDDPVKANSIKRILNISGTIGDTLSTVTRYEDSDNIKIYIADGKSTVRVVNIAKGISYYDATATAGNALYTTENSISIYKNVQLNQPSILSYSNGALKSGMIQFGYQLFDKNGVETEVSDLTDLIPLYNYSTSSELNTKGIAKDESAGVSIKIHINLVSSIFDYLKIIAVYYNENGQLANIYVLDNKKISNLLSYDYTCETLENAIQTYSISEFNTITGSHIIPSILEVKNNYLFAANIKYDDQPFNVVDFDTRAFAYDVDGNCEFKDGVKLTNWGVLNSTTISDDAENISNDLSISNPANITQKYCKLYNQVGSDLNTIYYGGCGSNIAYKFLTVELLEDECSSIYSHTGENINNNNINVYYHTYDGGTILKADKITNFPSGIRNYSNPLISSSYKSLQRDEIYRYGIVFYDSYGNKSIVHWIGDIRTPSSLETGFEIFKYVGGKLYTYPLGIEFSLRSLPTGAVSYQIVRCLRTHNDRATVVQCILSIAMTRPLSTWCGNNSNYLTPSSILTINSLRENTIDQLSEGYAVSYALNDITGSSNTSRCTYSKNNYYNVYCPEYSYLPQTYKNYLSDISLYALPINYVTNSKFDSTDLTPYSVGTYGNGINGTNTIIDNAEYMSGSTVTDLPTTGVSCFPFSAFSTTSEVDDRNADNSTYKFSHPALYEAYDSNTGHFCYTMGSRYGYNYDKLYKNSKSFIGSNTNSSTFTTRNITELGKYTISNVSFALEPGWNSYENRQDYVSTVNGLEYNNWVRTGYGTIQNAANDYDEYAFQGPAGRSFVCNIPFGIQYTYPGNVTNSTIESTSLTSNGYTVSGNASTFICNLRKYVSPYGGGSKAQRSLSTYYPVSSKLTLSPNNLSNDAYKLEYYFTPIFNGDTFICNYDFIKVHRFHYKITNKYLWGGQVAYSVPVETSINLSLKQGPKINGITTKDVQIEAGNFNNEYSQDTPYYTYNTVYSQESNVKLNMPEGEFDEYNKQIDTRTCYSNVKTNDELTDNWCKFQALNYIDVDSRYGPITQLRTFNNDLIYWQLTAVGKFSVNERSVVTDANTNALTVGTGGVLNRYDYLATVNGMRQNDLNDTQSDNVLYWFDYDKNELCIYSGGDTACVSKQVNVQNYLNNIKNNSIYKAKVSSVYDKKYNEAIFNLDANSAESLVYSEIIKAYIGIYNIPFTDSIMFSDGVVLAQDDALYHINRASSSTGTTFNGDTTTLLPYLQFIVNSNYNYVKVFDNEELSNTLDLSVLKLSYHTDKITNDSSIQNDTNNKYITDREYSYRLAIPRYSTTQIGDRYRGRALTVTLEYTDYSDIELSYIKTTFRPSLS